MPFMPPGNTPATQGRHRVGVPTLAASRPGRGDTAASPFTGYALAHAARCHGRAIAILQAGCTTAGSDLDLAALRAAGHDLDVCLIDDECPATRQMTAARPELGSAILSELRQIPLRPRSFDIVHCSLLLHRIAHAEVVLGRLAATLRPRGLLLLRIADPGSAAGFLDRRMPRVLRAPAWQRSHPGQPGPHPAVYDPVASPAGVEAFVSRHGLSVVHREAAWSAGGIWPTPPARHRPPHATGRRAVQVAPAVRLVSLLSAGRLGCDHDAVRYVIRKPEDRFARVLD